MYGRGHLFFTEQVEPDRESPTGDDSQAWDDHWRQQGHAAFALVEAHTRPLAKVPTGTCYCDGATPSNSSSGNSDIAETGSHTPGP